MKIFTLDLASFSFKRRDLKNQRWWEASFRVVVIEGNTAEKLQS